MQTDITDKFWLSLYSSAIHLYIISLGLLNRIKPSQTYPRHTCLHGDHHHNHWCRSHQCGYSRFQNLYSWGYRSPHILVRTFLWGILVDKGLDITKQSKYVSQSNWSCKTWIQWCKVILIVCVCCNDVSLDYFAIILLKWICWIKYNPLVCN